MPQVSNSVLGIKIKADMVVNPKDQTGEGGVY